MEEVTVAVDVMEYPAFRFSKHLKSWVFLVNQLTQGGLHLVNY
tara:strand:- start:620 stop:748 length:129 start_codon:yes stop_codon:yes gene_type:complete